jgi:hypothetical protein
MFIRNVIKKKKLKEGKKMKLIKQKHKESHIGPHYRHYIDSLKDVL